MPSNTLSNRERLQEISSGVEKGIQELFRSDRYRNYLCHIHVLQHFACPEWPASGFRSDRP